MTSPNIEFSVIPFRHVKISNFLSKNTLDQIKNAFESLTFHHKKTDLFSFHQTDSISLNLLTNEIKNFLILKNVNISSVDVFASYYLKNDYLLPHDDTIDDRKIAFCYYLNNFESGELIMYNEECNLEIKRINVEENLLVMFGVENAFHEVAICKEDGRMAITGWFSWKENVDGGDVLEKSFFKDLIDSHDESNDQTNKMKDNFEIENLDTNKESDVMKENLEIMKEKFFMENNINKTNLIRENFDINKNSSIEINFVIKDFDTIKTIENFTIDLDKTFKHEEGPFYNRRIGLIKGGNTNIILPGYELHSKKSYKLRIGDYILLNDGINDFEDEVVDVFYFENDDEVPVINYVNFDGEIEMEISSLKNYLFVIKRNGMKIFIERSENELFFEHFIFKK
ncbi:Prolyl 3-hydroxylase ogfod1 [Gurleya vavrai]